MERRLMGIQIIGIGCTLLLAACIILAICLVGWQGVLEILSPTQTPFMQPVPSVVVNE